MGTSWISTTGFRSGPRSSCARVRNCRGGAMPIDLPNPSLAALPSAAGRTRRSLPIRQPRARSRWSFRDRLLAWASLLLALASALVVASPAAAQTLTAVRERGALVCGVSHGLLGFSSVDDKGNWSGFDVDLCRPIAAAIFNDAGKVRFVPLDAAARFAALKSGDVDVLSRNSTWTMSRETTFGLVFAAVTYYDGQGFLVRKALNVESALELDGKSFCLQTGTTGELNVADYFRANNMTYSAVELASLDEILTAYDGGRCDVFATDVSQLHAERLKLAKPDERHPARRHLQGTARSRGAARRRSVVHHREMDAFRHGQCRRAGGQLEDHRTRDAVGEAGGETAGRHRGEFRRAGGSGQRLGSPDRQAGRQLRRSVRAQHRHEIPARHSARPQSPLDDGRHPICSADPMSAGAGIPAFFRRRGTSSPKPPFYKH